MLNNPIWLARWPNPPGRVAIRRFSGDFLSAGISIGCAGSSPGRLAGQGRRRHGDLFGFVPGWPAINLAAIVKSVEWNFKRTTEATQEEEEEEEGEEQNVGAKVSDRSAVALTIKGERVEILGDCSSRWCPLSCSRPHSGKPANVEERWSTTSQSELCA